MTTNNSTLVPNSALSWPAITATVVALATAIPTVNLYEITNSVTQKQHHNTSFNSPDLVKTGAVPTDAIKTSQTQSEILQAKLNMVRNGIVDDENKVRLNTAINQIEAFFEANMSQQESLSLPHIFETRDKEINLFWEQEFFKLDINFAGDDTYYFYYWNQSGVKLTMDDRPFREPLPQIIFEALNT